VWILESLHSIGIGARLELFASADLFIHARERLAQSIPGAIRRVHGDSSQSQSGNVLRFESLLIEKQLRIDHIPAVLVN